MVDHFGRYPGRAHSWGLGDRSHSFLSSDRLVTIDPGYWGCSRGMTESFAKIFDSSWSITQVNFIAFPEYCILDCGVSSACCSHGYHPRSTHTYSHTRIFNCGVSEISWCFDWHWKRRFCAPSFDIYWIKNTTIDIRIFTKNCM